MTGRLPAPFSSVAFLQLAMEQQMVVIPLAECERMLRHLTRAEYYCAHARSSQDPTVDIIHDDSTTTYPGASGFAGATMRDVIQTLETYSS